MDPIEILGELLGRKTKKPSRGGDVLTEIFGRRKQSEAGASPPTADAIRRQAEELEDLLNVAHQSSQQRTSERQRKPSQPIPPLSGFPQTKKSPPSFDSQESRAPQPQNQDDKAIVLIKAMINAAKADGRLDSQEQQKILEQVGNSSRQGVDFVRQELSKPLDIDEFVRSVPFGMEQQVYTMSLIAIDLDTGGEVNYLAKLAERLRLPLDVREQIHQRLGAPSVF